GGGKSSAPELTKFKTQVPADAPNPSLARGTAPVVDSHKNEPPKPATLCAVAAVRDQMAANPDLSFADAEQTHAQARHAYQQAIALDPKYGPAYIGLAKSFAAIDDAAQASAMYEKALERQPKDANLWYEKALMHARFKEWDNAIA